MTSKTPAPISGQNIGSEGPVTRGSLKYGLLPFALLCPPAMFLLFYGLVLPVGLIARILGRDPLRLKLDSKRGSYWIPRVPPGPAPNTWNNQF